MILQTRMFVKCDVFADNCSVLILMVHNNVSDRVRVHDTLHQRKTISTFAVRETAWIQQQMLKEPLGINGLNIDMMIIYSSI